MTDLRVNFAGLKLKNPFVVASSELTNTVEKIKLAEKYRAVLQYPSFLYQGDRDRT